MCEDWAAIEAPVLVVGGWNDAYSNAVPRLMKGLRTPRKAIIGPWAHKYPHFAVPEPRIGFLQEMLALVGPVAERRADRHHAASRTSATTSWTPYKPDALPGQIDGRWVGDAVWGFGNVETRKWYPERRRHRPRAGEEKAITISSKQTTGLDGGEYCIIWLGPEFPGDQRRDDAQSLTFDSPALVTAMDIVGQPAVDLDFTVDKPVAFVAVRLNDVWPTGEVSRITYHLQNLCMRESREKPSPLDPGKRYRMRIKLDDIAWRMPKGHRLRVSISTTYFPLMWPAPEPVTLTVYTGKSYVHIPVGRKWPATRRLPSRLPRLLSPSSGRNGRSEPRGPSPKTAPGPSGTGRAGARRPVRRRP